ncbi:MAG: amidase [Myxococcota bacterium]|nr:amidase [Myxococcota bacterium]
MASDANLDQALWRLSAVDSAKGLSQGDFSAAELTDSILARMKKVGPDINAVVVDLSEQALETAQRADESRKRGEALGPLHGIPVTTKINIDQVGTATSNGLPALAQQEATDDSPVVRNFREAGAVIFGRTNTPEFSMRATTVNPLFGRTHNPWDAEASAGGSSGGAGAAAAAGIGAIHHGNDIGGSLRFPSFANGVCTVKPTLGRVPAFNPSAPAERGLLAQLMSVQGVICREVADVRLGLKSLARGDTRDPWWVPAPFDDWHDAPPRRVALTRESHGYAMHAGIEASLDRAATMLKDAGYEVIEVKTPSIEKPAKDWQNVAIAEVRATLGSLAEEFGSEDVKRVFEYFFTIGDLVDDTDYRINVAERTALTREWNVFLEEFPLVLSPFMMRSLYPHDYDIQGLEETRDLLDASIYSMGVNYLSLPAGVMPVDLVDGLPAGVQIMGRRFREDLILDAMQEIEDRNGVFVHQLWNREEN